MLDNLLLLIAVAPGAFLLFLIYVYDRYEREPILLVLLCFAVGAASTMLALILEVTLEPIFMAMPYTVGLLLLYTVLGIGLPEELSKLIVVRFVAFKNKAFNEPMDGIVYMVAAGMGFATLENVLYVTELGLEVGILRAFLSVPMHALFGVVLGYYVGRAHAAHKQGRGSIGLLLFGLILATVIHGFYDFILYAIEDMALLLIVLVAFYALLVLFAVILIRRALAVSPFINKTITGRRA